MPVADCVWSALRLHNETLNVWTHLFALGVFVHHAAHAPRFANATMAQALVEVTFLGAAVLCFSLSVAFHLLGPASARAYDRLHKADVAGILALIVACFLVGLELAFECVPHWARSYQLAITAISFAFGAWFANARGVPASSARFLVALGACSLVPVLHWACVQCTSAEVAAFG
eukprot:CAMPEP_0185198668 /NCGR_PEP_ID=MMETSP1140-20130426/43436_1 /TAXON_ID=298111 /ORGANISM="Pavlova sp., Strain CCMP459" /LENGTH=173 /DNA_ID=CAMNT_0027765885 /DNA_START=156 /DNA_END=673 /DNA_ORIENTATION=+